VILGAYEVDQEGRVANWSTADEKRGGIGGAMDLLSGKGDLIIVMEHVDSKGRPKLRKKCTYPLTGKESVSYVVTDLALLRWDGHRFVLESVSNVRGPNYVAAQAKVVVTRGGKPVSVLYPERRIYTVQEQVMTEAAIDPGPTRDLYVSLGDPFTDGTMLVDVYTSGPAIVRGGVLTPLPLLPRADYADAAKISNGVRGMVSAT